ncbi:MAG: hypothetical protein AAF495_14675 [Pseudomonadota bacterium]
MSERIRVVIATTEGPAAVERLSEEDPAVGSVICLQCKAVALPISPAYDAFVRRPTGVIEAAYGHPAYRLDVSAPISDGFSWQLGALAAHGLSAAGRLAGRDDPCDRILWVTGEVDQSLSVLGVEHLAEKLRASAALIGAARGDGIKVTLCLPQANMDMLDPDWRHMLGESVELLPVESVRGLFARLRLKTPAIGRCATPPRRRVRTVALASVACLGVLTVQVPPPGDGGEGRSVISSAASRETKTIELTALELRAPPGSSCAAVHLGEAVPEVREVPLTLDGPAARSSARALCNLRFQLTNRGAPKALWLVGARAGAGADMLYSKTIVPPQHLASGERRQFEVTLPRRLPAALSHSFAIIAEPAPQTAGPEATLSPDAWDSWAAGLKAAGHEVISAEHSLLPR